MNKCFVDIIPEIEREIGVSSLEYLPVAINQSKYYGFDGLAEWFQYYYDRLTQAVKEEHNAEPFGVEDASTP